MALRDKEFLTPFLLAATLVLSVSCGSNPYSGQNPATVASTFSSIQANILTPKCAVCHYTQDPRGGFSVSSYQEVMSSPGAVTPFQSYASELYTQCLSGNMPKKDRTVSGTATLTPLSSNELNEIYNWISYGAANN